MKAVYQISDLTDRATLDAGADKPARLAVIGNPVAHSASPVMHQAALDALGMNIRYIRLEVKPGEVAEAFQRMAELGFIGCNVTVPHKLEAIESCHSLTADANAIGVVNTVSFSESEGHAIGHNTDGPGLAQAIREDFGAELGKLRVMILGVGGGAGKAIATQCAMLNCPKVWLINRSIEKAHALATDLHSTLNIPKEKLAAMNPNDSLMEQAARDTDLIINATSLGMENGDPLPVNSEFISPEHMVYDAIYKPAETALLKQAKTAQAKTANGFSMLLHQGVLAFEYWFPGQSPVSDMRRGLSSTI